MDHHIGTLRQSLASVGHSEDTAILYGLDLSLLRIYMPAIDWSISDCRYHADHGWQLGEHSMYICLIIKWVLEMMIFLVHHLTIIELY